LLSVGEAAGRLGTPVRFVRRLIAERRIRFYKIGRYVRLDAADLDAFVAAGKIDPHH
jgi:excisionase family DNA binding protein